VWGLEKGASLTTVENRSTDLLNTAIFPEFPVRRGSSAVDGHLEEGRYIRLTALPLASASAGVFT
jgi:hypothetical protein